MCDDKFDFVSTQILRIGNVRTKRELSVSCTDTVNNHFCSKFIKFEENTLWVVEIWCLHL